jgi:16S rRNA (uracil1498-N3)-methyltransferase
MVLFTGQGGEFSATFVPGDRNSGAFARVTAHHPVEREAGLDITLIQGLCAHDRSDWLLEKCIEAGVNRVVFVPTQRSVIRLDEERSRKRLQRWQDMAIAACCQCGRNRIPVIDWAADLAGALKQPASGSLRWMLDPQASNGLVRGTLEQKPVCLLIGPEGGLTRPEQDLARDAGFLGARLGPRVLRTETAGLLAVGALLTLHGDLG